ncbi:protein of unknown function [Streptomyces sp. KY70]|nr:protein of unknown function [Streptomyces sp. KY70]
MTEHQVIDIRFALSTASFRLA